MKSNILDPLWPARSPRCAASAGSIPANSASSSRSCWTARGRCRKRGSSTKSRSGKAAPRPNWCAALGLDAGFLSRTLQALQRRQIVARKPSKSDRRVTELALTAKGRAAFADLDRRSRSAVAALARRNSTARRAPRSSTPWPTIERTLEPPARQAAPFLLRSHRPGDIGWVVSRHGAALRPGIWLGHQFRSAGRGDRGAIHPILRSVARALLDRRNRRRAGRLDLPGQGVRRGRQTAAVAGRRDARAASGVGRALAEQCIRFAREDGYGSITLWTQSILVAARGIYQRAGFQRVAEEKHHSFGVDLVGETWELTL